jgi:uncharacterized protein YcbK (DUF882 family)
MRWIALVAPALALVLWASAVGAAGKATAVRYTVQRGDTLSSIAAHFGVSVGSICRWNAIKKDALLSPGRKIGVPLPPGQKAPEAVAPRPRTTATAGAAPAKSWQELSDKPARPGWVVLRSYTGEWQGQLVGADGQVLAEGARHVTELMIPRAKGGEPAIDSRLLVLIARVSDKFGGRRMHLVSGYRPGFRSRHGRGQAIDFRIEGVPNSALRDYLLTLDGALGIGYYPNSYHVHLDVREQRTTWIDLSRPGQRARYVKPKRTASAKARQKRARR